jgi:cytochrome c oxidase subunit 2
MSFLLVAQKMEDFNAWLAQQQKPAMEPQTDEQKRGRDIFVKSTCAMCHTIRGTDAGARTGPDLTHLASRETIAAGTLPNNPGSLGGWIMDAQGVKPGALMPPQQLSGDDLQALISYLQSLK